MIDVKKGYGFKKELKIEYNQIVINPISQKPTTYGKADIYKEGGLNAPLNHTTKFEITAPNGKSTYEVSFWGTSDSLILYKFKKLPDEDDDDSEEAENSNTNSDSVFTVLRELIKVF